MTVSRVRPSAGAWPRTISSPGGRTCGASPRSTPSTSPAWRMCSTSMPSRPTRSGRWSASTKALPSSSAKRASRSRPRRNGTVNLFVFLDAHRSWRRVKVTDRRTADDFALCMRELVDVDFKQAERIRVVLDNLSTHTAAALYAAFPPAEARRVLRRLEFHYTPKHASWLNMVEIEIGVLKGQCLDRRIESCDCLVAEIDVWQSQRNQSGARINWMFSTDVLGQDDVAEDSISARRRSQGEAADVSAVCGRADRAGRSSAARRPQPRGKTR